MLVRRLVQCEIVVVQIIVNVIQHASIQNMLWILGGHGRQSGDVGSNPGSGRRKRLGHREFRCLGTLVLELVHVLKVVQVVHWHYLTAASTLSNLFQATGILRLWCLSGRAKHHLKIVKHLVLRHSCAISIPGGRIYWKIKPFYTIRTLTKSTTYLCHRFLY